MAPNTLDPVTKSTEKMSAQESSVRSRLLIQKDEKVLDDNHNESTTTSHSNSSQQISADKIPFKPKIRWPDLMAQVFIHAGSIYGLFYLITLKAAFYTYVWCKSSNVN